MLLHHDLAGEQAPGPAAAQDPPARLRVSSRAGGCLFLSSAVAHILHAQFQDKPNAGIRFAPSLDVAFIAVLPALHLSAALLAAITTEQSVNTPGWLGDRVAHEQQQRGKDTAVRIRPGASLLREALRILTHCGATLLTDMTTARVAPEQKWREANPQGCDPGHDVKGSSSVTD